MSNADPIFYVTIVVANADGGGTHDVSERIMEMSFEDVEAKADKLTLKVDNFDLTNFDAPIWKTGNEVEVSWGYPGNMSPTRVARITSVKGGTTLQVEAMDPSIVMNKIARVRTFEKMKRSDVAAQIADEYAFGEDRRFIDDSVEVLAQVTQARMTDAQLLRDMARREGWEFYVDFDGFHFHPRKLGQQPLRRFAYYAGDDAGDIESWTLENDIYARKAGGMTAKGIDPKTKEEFEAKGDHASDNASGLAPEKVIITGISDRDGSPTGDLVKETGSEAVSRSNERSLKTAERAVQGAWKKNQMNAAEISMECKGDPQMLAKTVIEVVGIGQTISGNYYVTQVTHKLGSGYKMTVKAKRDGKSAATNTAAQGQSVGSGTGNGGGVPGNGTSNTQSAGGGGRPGDPPPDTQLVTVVDPRSGGVLYTETRGRTQSGTAPSGGDKGRVPGVTGEP